MAEITTPRETKEPCRHCRGTGTAFTWARPDLGEHYTDSAACGSCSGGFATVTHCPTPGLCGPCDLPLLNMPHLGEQRGNWYVSVLGCPNGHRYERQWTSAGALQWTRIQDVDVLAVAS